MALRKEVRVHFARFVAVYYLDVWMCEIEEHNAALAVPGDSVVGRRCAFARLLVMRRLTVTLMWQWWQNHAVTLLLPLMTT